MDINSTARTITISLLIAVALPLVYFLSMGPATVLWKSGYMSDHVFNRAYAPLYKTCYENDTAWWILRCYETWWMDPSGT